MEFKKIITNIIIIMLIKMCIMGKWEMEGLMMKIKIRVLDNNDFNLMILTSYLFYYLFICIINLSMIILI